MSCFVGHGPPSAALPSPGPPKISLFFSLSRHSFHSFFPPGGRFVEFWWCFGLPGCRVKPRRICACIQKKNSNTTEIPREDALPSSGPHLLALTFSGCCLCCLCCCFFFAFAAAFVAAFGPPTVDTSPMQCLTFTNVKNNFTMIGTL